MNKIKYIFVVGAFALMGSCVTPNYMAEHADVLLEYQRHPTKVNLMALSQAYSTTLNANRERGEVQPGLYADYGVTLALMGRNSEANIMFNNEIALYPNASFYVNYLKLQLTPEYVSDTSTWVNMQTLDTLYAPLKQMQDSVKAQQAKEAELNIDLIDDPSDRQAAIEAKKAKQKQRDEERRQREKAKKQQEKEKQELKKQQEAAREEAKRQKAVEQENAKQKQEAEREVLRQQKDQQREEIKRQKATEKEQKIKEREALKQQKAVEKEQQRKEKEEMRKQKEAEKEELRQQREAEKEELRKEQEELKRQKALEKEELRRDRNNDNEED